MSRTLNIGWSAEPGAAGYRVEVGREGSAFEPVYQGPATSTAAVVDEDGIYRVRVSAYREGGASGPWAEQSVAVSGASSPLSATLSTTSISGTVQAGPVVTPAVTCLVTGGSRPYDFQWLRSAGDPVVVARKPAAQSSSFVFEIRVGQAIDASYACLVTDAENVQTYSNDVDISYTGTAAPADPTVTVGVPVGTWLEWSSSTPPSGPWLPAGSYLVNDWPELGAFYGVAPGGNFVVPDRSDTMPGGTSGVGAPGDVVGTNTMDLRHKTLPGELKMPAHAHGAGTLQAADHTHQISPSETTVQAGVGATVQSAPNATGNSGALTVTGSTADSTTGPEARITGESEVIDWQDDGPAGRIQNPALAEIRPKRFLLVWYQRAASF